MYAVAVTVGILFPDGVVALGRCASVWESETMSWWKPLLKWIGKKALAIAAEEVGKKVAKKT